ncbi:MAG: hypothetical protein AUK19_00175 [Candidatus Moranbacteria bacterium CG2_30_45_14]|nr:MAG: hypothetical protein AUK19_00175 [Candidatus Moranbacteria bacterium CG2_30_45_14]
MKKVFKKAISFFSISILFLAVSAFWSTAFPSIDEKGRMISIASADDEKDEEDEEDDRGGNDNYSTSTAKQKEEKVKPVYRTVMVQKIITVLDPIFTVDTDTDGVVDGLDPHPTIPEKEFFTDDDNDGIANAFDAHVGEDDFAYYEQENDENGNGILDSYEAVAGN